MLPPGVTLTTLLADSSPVGAAVGGLYASLTGRAATPDKVAPYQQQLTQPGTSLADVHTAIAASGDEIGAVPLCSPKCSA